MTLPDLPLGLTELNCSENLLAQLPPLPLSLYELGCRTNQLSVLPLLPPQLEWLDCSYNNLVRMPNFPASILAAKCDGNAFASSVLQSLSSLDNCHAEFREYFVLREKTIVRLRNVVTLKHVVGSTSLPADIVAGIGCWLSGREGTLATQIEQVKKELLD
jgi:Leucine-rich repeat (LRR) protein